MSIEDFEHAWRTGADLESVQGVVRSERETQPFRCLESAGSYKVLFRQGPESRILVAAETAEAARQVVTRVERGTLYVEPLLTAHRIRTASGSSVIAAGPGSIAAAGDVIIRGRHVVGEGVVMGDGLDLGAAVPRGAVVICVMQPNAPDVELSGSGIVVLDHVAQERLALEISGSGVIVAKGRADRLQMEISGSGSLDTLGLETYDVECEISGSGSMEVRATKRLDAEISGSGSITVRGTRPPVCATEVSGSGNIWFENRR